MKVFVYTMNRLGKVGAWSRYEFPWEIDDYTIRGNTLYMRHGDVISRVDPQYESDQVLNGEIMDIEPFEWLIQWPWLDFGAMGVTKMLEGFDIIGYGVARIQFGYDQSNGELWTPEWELVADSVPGQLLPMPLSAPSMAVRLIYDGSDEQRTGWDALNLHFHGMRETA